MGKKIVASLIGLLLCAAAILEVCIGHTFGKGHHYFVSKEPFGFWCHIGIILALAVVAFCVGIFASKNGD